MLLVYLWLPITRLVVAHASKHNLQYLLGIWFVFGIVYPTLRDFWPFTLLAGIPVQWLVNMTYAAIGYTVLGYYLKTYPIPLRGALVCLISGFLIVFGGTSFLSVPLLVVLNVALSYLTYVVLHKIPILRDWII